MGGAADVSPGLDRLAREGAQFDHVLAQSNWTRASIASFLTSQYPRTLGIYKEEDGKLDDVFTQLAEFLKTAGYTTIGFTANPNLNTIFNFQQGFDSYSESTVVFDWMQRAADGKVRGPETSLPHAPNLFRDAINRVKSANHPPYYLQFNLMEVHEWRVDWAYKSFVRPEYTQLFDGHPYAPYLRMVRQVTDDVAAFVDELRSLPGWENSIFVFVSDHGEGLSDHPNVPHSTFHGEFLYESTSVVPWIVVGPGRIPPHSHVPQQVRLLDLVPTLLDGVHLSAAPGMKGTSLWPVLTGARQTVSLPRENVVESQYRRPQISLYSEDWILIRSSQAAPGTDPLELQPRGLRKQDGTRTNELAAHPEVAENMKRLLDAWEKEVPEAPTSSIGVPLPEELKEQLGAAGYLR